MLTCLFGAVIRHGRFQWLEQKSESERNGLLSVSCLCLFSCKENEFEAHVLFSHPLMLFFLFRYAASDLIWIFGATVAVVTSHALLYKSREEHETDTLFDDPV